MDSSPGTVEEGDARRRETWDRGVGRRMIRTMYLIMNIISLYLNVSGKSGFLPLICYHCCCGSLVCLWSPVPGLVTRSRTEVKKDASNPLVRVNPVRERRQHATCYSGFGAGTETQKYLVDLQHE